MFISSSLGRRGVEWEDLDGSGQSHSISVMNFDSQNCHRYRLLLLQLLAFQIFAALHLSPSTFPVYAQMNQRLHLC